MRSASLLFIVALSLGVGCDTGPSSPPPTPGLVYPIRLNDQWGAIDSQGVEIAPPRFSTVAWANVEQGSSDLMSAKCLEVGQESILLISKQEWLLLNAGSKRAFPQSKEWRKGFVFFNLGDSLFAVWDQYKSPTDQTEALTFDPTQQWQAPANVLAFGKVSEGLVPIIEGGKYGYANRAGATIIQPRFKRAQSFKEGVAAVEEEEGWTYIDKNGVQVISEHYSYASGFDRGIALVLDRLNREEKFAIDRNGTRLATFKWRNEARLGNVFSEGLIRYNEGEAGWGFMDANGVWKIKPQFSTVTDFSEGLAGAILGGGPPRSGYIDWTGEFVVLVPNAKKLGEFRKGLAWVETDDGTVGYVDKKGEWRWKHDSRSTNP